MYISTFALLLTAYGVKATAVLAQRAPGSLIVNRDVSVGWSLQSPSAVDDTTSCGNGAYCPSSLTCNEAANHEVAACCSSSSDCRGDAEGSPKCPDSSWSLWIGYDGNGFCCEVGMIGAYDITDSVAGTCVSDGSLGTLRTAVLTSTGTGASATSAPSSAASSASTASMTSASSASSASSESESSASSSSSAASVSRTATATTMGASSTGATQTSGIVSSTSAAATANSAEMVGMGFGLIGAAFLAVAAL